MPWAGRWRWGLILLGLVLVLAAATPFVWQAGKPPVEVGILLGTSDRSWSDFFLAVDLAADEQGLPFNIDKAKHECSVDLGDQRLVFRWYPEAGSRNIQYRVRDLVRSDKPPLALVGANNSTMTQAMVAELAAHSDSPATPVALLTYGTADYLLDSYPQRSFRFGFNNSYQAQAVVARLMDYYQEKKGKEGPLNVVLVEVLDDPFSVDLAMKFQKELSEKFETRFVPPPRGVANGEPLRGGQGSDQAWSLSTCTGSFNTPNEEETKLARCLVEQMTSNPEREWVLVLPVGTDSFRRITNALTSALREIPGQPMNDTIVSNLTILSGDSMNYYTFAEHDRSFLDPSKVPAAVILFAHVNPMDKSVAVPPNNHIPSRSLNRDVARALLSVLKDPSARTNPETLGEALKNYVQPGGSTSFFRDRERRDGGGAVLVVPDQTQFHVQLPSHWLSEADRLSAR